MSEEKKRDLKAEEPPAKRKKTEISASAHKIVSREEWLEARKAYLAEEKAFQKERDRLSAKLRELPWVKVEKEYSFETMDGSKQNLADLFGECNQLIVNHFMFGAKWEAGCTSCSFMADSFDGLSVHLKRRDVAFVAISKAPPEKLKAYKERMGWTFDWVSAQNTGFNEDYQVSFSQEDVDNKNVTYNYKDKLTFPSTEAPGMSVFVKDEKTGEVYHTYSTYARGLDRLLGGYHFLDMVPKGRDEDGLGWPMEWLRRHDEYDKKE